MCFKYIKHMSVPMTSVSRRATKNIVFLTVIHNIETRNRFTCTCGTICRRISEGERRSI